MATGAVSTSTHLQSSGMDDRDGARRERPGCHSGGPLIECGGCLTLRCPDRDPYRSDDCFFAL
jgi:hypothetical protein